MGHAARAMALILMFSLAAAGQTPVRHLSPLLTSETGEGSRVTISADFPLGDYAIYQNGDRFYVVVAQAATASAQSDVSGRWFADAEIGRRGNDTVYSFRLLPGARPRVTPQANSLVVDFVALDSPDALALTGEEALAQTSTPTQTPTTPATPAQQDATRPPGTEQRQQVPPPARPVPQDPTAPPGAERPAPDAPPGRETAPQTGTPRTPAPVSPALPGQTPIPPVAPPQTPITGQEPVRDPAFPRLEMRPVPPLPPLTRLGVESDNAVPLTLNEAIRRALVQNNQIEVARADVLLAETVLRSLEGIYDPIFSITPQYTNSVSPQASSLGGSGQTGTVSQTDLELNPSVTQLMRAGGGPYQFFFNNLRRSTTSTFSQFSPFYSSSAGVTFTQPLLRNRAIDNNRRNIRIQQRRLQQTDADFRRQVTEIINQVQQAYWDLVFALRDQQNRIANLNLVREQFRLTEARVVAGASPPLERAEVATELANREAELLVAAQNVSFAENNLKRLILRDPLAPEWTAAFMPTDTPAFDETPVRLSDALTAAQANRPELSRLRFQQEINQIDLEYFRNQTRPRIDLVGTVSSTGLAGTPVVNTGSGTVTQVPLITGNPNTAANAFLLAQINQLRAAQGLGPADVPLVTPQTSTVAENLVGGYGQMLRNLFGFDTRNVSVGVAIQIPFRNRTAEANLTGARIQQEQLAATQRSQEQVIIVEVRNAAQAVETARRRVLAARTARENAELQLSGERQLYQVGRSTTFLLFQRENQLVNARNQELRAETDYNKALAELQRATATTLRANGVTVTSPTNGR